MSKLKIDKFIKDKEVISELKKKEQSAVNLLEQIYDVQDDLKAVNKNLYNLNEKWKTVPDVCPLCEGKGKLK